MADATASYSSVGVWEQLHCFFFAWGFPSSLWPGADGQGPVPVFLSSKEETVELLQHANGGVSGFSSLRDDEVTGLLADSRVQSLATG